MMMHHLNAHTRKMIKFIYQTSIADESPERAKCSFAALQIPDYDSSMCDLFVNCILYFPMHND